ncbi:MAG: heat-inducible transcriptional repressor HrcA [Deltaproteobacteria bacterium]|nr:heat-inducible transcriptional repressor HrcA [Deltaproteobacteria bacterium]
MLNTKRNQFVSSKETLSERYSEVLNLLVADYIATCDAIGSRHLSKKIVGRLSPATIRSVMSDLEEMGYLSHPHTSAGRIPTQKGLRYHVDTFIGQGVLGDSERSAIEEQYRFPEKDIRSLMLKTGKVLAGISRYAGLVATPKWEKTAFKHIEFLPLSRGRLLGIFVSQNGMVENRVLEIHEEVNYRELEKINNYCNASFLGLTLEEARTKVGKELSQARQEYDALLTKALLFSQELLTKIETEELLVEWESQLLDAPEFSTVERVKELMQMLEEKNQLLKVLDSCMESSGVRIFIGAESHCEAAKNLSLITATYKQGKQVIGTLGVIGPTRMDYSRVIPMVDFTAKLVTDLLNQTL